MATSVHALEVPSSGGNTCFASGYRAYESLSDEFKARLEGLRSEYALGKNHQERVDPGALDREAAGRSKELGHGLSSDHLPASGHAAAGHLRQPAADDTGARCERRRERGYFGDLVRGDPPGRDDRRALGARMAGCRYHLGEPRRRRLSLGPDGLSARRAPDHDPLHHRQRPDRDVRGRLTGVSRHSQDDLGASFGFLEGHEVAAAGHLRVSGVRQFVCKRFLQLPDPGAAGGSRVRAHQMCQDREVRKAVVGGCGSADGVVGAGLDLGRTAELQPSAPSRQGPKCRLAMRREHLPRKKAEGRGARHGVEIRLGRLEVLPAPPRSNRHRRPFGVVCVQDTLVVRGTQCRVEGGYGPPGQIRSRRPGSTSSRRRRSGPAK